MTAADVRFTVEGLHTADGLVMTTVGNGFTVTVTVLVAEQVFPSVAVTV